METIRKPGPELDTSKPGPILWQQFPDARRRYAAANDRVQPGLGQADWRAIHRRLRRISSVIRKVDAQAPEAAPPSSQSA